MKRTTIILTAGLIAMLSANTQAADEALTGRVLTPEGKGACEAFVFLNNDPYRSQGTDHEGRFRIPIDGLEAPYALKASWAACEIAEVSLGDAAKEIAIQLKAQDPTFTKLEVGGALKTTRIGGDAKVGQYYSENRPLSETEQACVDAWEAFLKDRGEKIIAKMQAGETLGDDEKPYRFLLAAEIRSRLPSRFLPKAKRGEAPPEITDPNILFCKRAIEAGKLALAKAYKREPLSESDLDALRSYRAIKAIFHPSVAIRPSDAAGYHGRLKPMEIRNRGESIQDFPALRFTSLLKSPGIPKYSTLTLTESVRFESLAFVFDAAALCKVDQNGQFIPVTKDDLAPRCWRVGEDLLSYHDLCEEKPAMIFPIIMEDRTYPNRTVRFAEYLRRAYANRVDIYYIQALSPIFGDMFTDEYVYFGPNPDQNPLQGLLCRPGEEDRTPQRLMRTIKNCCMEHPVLTGEMLLGIYGWPVHFSGDGMPYCLDKSGVLFVDQRDAMNRRNVSYYGGYWEEGCYRAIYTDKFFMELQVYEAFLREVLANKGVYTPEMNKNVFMEGYPKKFFNTTDYFLVDRYDAEAGVLHARCMIAKRRGGYGGASPVAPDKAAVGHYRFKISPDTRISMIVDKDGRPQWFYDAVQAAGESRLHRAADKLTVAQLTIGDLPKNTRFYADFYALEKPAPRKSFADEISKADQLHGFDPKTLDGKIVDTVRIQNFQLSKGNTHPWMGWYTPLYGPIVAKEGNIVTVKIDRDDVRSMWGYTFWKEAEAGGKADARAYDKGDGYAARNWPIIKRWAEGAEEDRIYRFVIDPATRICHNGSREGKTHQDIKVGDYAYVLYETWRDPQQAQNEPIAPEMIMASTSIMEK